MSSARQKLRVAFFVLVAVFILLYILFQSKNLILGPQITITEPLDGATLTYNLVTIKGKAQNISSIRIDDRSIFIDNQGLFNEKLIAPVGYSIIQVEGSDRFGKKEQKLIHLYLPQSAVPVPTVSTTSVATTSSATSAPPKKSGDEAGPATSSDTTR